MLESQTKTENKLTVYDCIIISSNAEESMTNGDLFLYSWLIITENYVIVHYLLFGSAFVLLDFT